MQPLRRASTRRRARALQPDSNNVFFTGAMAAGLLLSGNPSEAKFSPLPALLLT